MKTDWMWKRGTAAVKRLSYFVIEYYIKIIVYAVHSSRPEVTAVGHSFGMGDGWTVGRRFDRLLRSQHTTSRNIEIIQNHSLNN